MRKGGVKVAREDKDADMVEGKHLEEGMIKTLPIMKRGVKVHNPQDIVGEELSQDHTEKGMISLILNVIPSRTFGVVVTPQI